MRLLATTRDANSVVTFGNGKGAVMAVPVWKRRSKTTGSVYFCAPIHLHGHEMFITSVIPRIHALFDPLPWKNVTIERSRYEYYPSE